jgi:acetyltransferase-like isoleucine patch superfamily enzyme
MTYAGKALNRVQQLARRLRLRWLFDVRLPGDCNLGRNITISGDVRIGPNVTIGDGVILEGNITIGSACNIGQYVQMNGDITLGDKTVVGSFSIVSAGPGATIRVGVDTYINSYNVLGANAALEIGSHCIFAAFVHITDATHGIEDISVATKHAEITASPVKIGDNVWLGSGVMVTMGSSIGNDAVVGAKSLVRGQLSDRSISFGTPAKLHRIRN